MKPQHIYIATIVTQLYFILAVSIAIFIYPHYRFMEQFLSALGVGEYGWIFNSAVILLGVVSFPFYISFYQTSAKLSIFITILGEISAIQLLGIGFFISDGATSKTHDIFAISLFLLFIPLGLLLAVALWRINRKSAFVASALAIFTFIGLFIPGVNQYLMQKIIVALYVLFLLLFSNNQLHSSI